MFKSICVLTFPECQESHFISILVGSCADLRKFFPLLLVPVCLRSRGEGKAIFHPDMCSDPDLQHRHRSSGIQISEECVKQVQAVGNKRSYSFQQ